MSLIGIVTLHFVADYLLQTRWMGNNKSGSNVALFYHVLVYFLCFTVFFGWQYAAVNAMLHFVVDWVTSRVSKYYYSIGDMYKFWAVIGFDQWCHMVCLIGTMSLISS